MTARPDPTGKPPSPRQQQALDLITAGIRSGRPPTLREIGAAMGIRSTNGVSCLLRALERKGWVEREPGELARCTYRPSARLPPLSDVWLFALAERLAQAIEGMHFFGIVQSIEEGRTREWVDFYRELFGFSVLPQGQYFGVLPKGTLLESPCQQFYLQLVEPPEQAVSARGAWA